MQTESLNTTAAERGWPKQVLINITVGGPIIFLSMILMTLCWILVTCVDLFWWGSTIGGTSNVRAALNKKKILLVTVSVCYFEHKWQKSPADAHPVNLLKLVLIPFSAFSTPGAHLYSTFPSIPSLSPLTPNRDMLDFSRTLHREIYAAYFGSLTSCKPTLLTKDLKSLLFILECFYHFRLPTTKR
jgi:hypothetical protein